MSQIKNRYEEIQKKMIYSFDYHLESLLREYDINKFVKLNANENFFVPLNFLSKILKEVAKDIDPRIYPIKEEAMLLDELKNYIRIPKDWIVLGNGADQLIEIVAKTFLRDDEEAISISPTFAVYRIVINNQGNVFREVPLNRDFSLNLDNLQSAINSKTILCFLCSPNNPTANQFKWDDIQKILENFKGIVILDEAYVEFASYSMINLVEKYENLIVFRTFSKIFGIAGLRLGYAVANPNLSGALRKMLLPYNINAFTLRVALRILQEKKAIKDALENLKKEREILIKKLNTIKNVKAYTSDTNFVLFKINRDIYDELLERKILIKNVGKIKGQGHYLRTTVGLPEMNKKLVNALEDILSINSLKST